MRIEINQPCAGQLFYIDEQGRMPVIRCEACLLDGDGQPVKATLQWSLQVVENIAPASCPSAKLGRQVVGSQGVSMGMGIWQPALAETAGGDALLSVTAEHGGRQFHGSVNFRIRGRNPSAAVVAERLGDKGSPLLWLANYLSGLKQFDLQGMPSLGVNGEVGVMRLCDPAAKQRQRWSWVQNVDAGKALFQRAEALARAYLDGNRVDGGYRNDRDVNDSTVLLLETLQRYLGGGAYWSWDEPQSLWLAQPPDSRVDELQQLALSMQ